MELHDYVDMKINKCKFEKIKKLYRSKPEQEIIDQVLDDILYMADMFRSIRTGENTKNERMLT